MQQTRRTFMATAAAVGALAATRVGVGAATPPAVRMSLSVFSQDAGRVESLRRGIAAMKALPASDHRSWFFQAATHAYSDALLAAEMKRDGKLKNVDTGKYWNKCPHFGQSSADFLIWHRGYLNNFEGILRGMAGDPTLALPYWDYGKAEQRTFPEIFAPEFVDEAKAIRNPLYHPNRERSFARGLLEISGMIGQAAKTVGSANFFHEVGTTGFGGDTLDSDHTQIGLLEQRPHNDIHLAVGGVINSTNGAMAEITTAAFDPVFWVHHANIDRMWAEWASKPDKRWGPMPSDSWFDERPWTFLDFDGNEKTISRREAVAMLAAYDVDYPQTLNLTPPAPPPPPPVAAAAPSSALPGSGGGVAPPMIIGAPRVMARARQPAEREILADHRPMTLTPLNPEHRQFGEGARAAKSTESETAAATTLNAPELSDPNAKVLLELSGITFKRVPSSGFAVYLDSGGTLATDPVGLIDIFGATHGVAGMNTMTGMPGMKSVQRFDVTKVVAGSPGPFALRVEPYDLLVTKAGKPGASRTDAVQIGSVRFVVVS
jgi:hypothetical protein